ncbi:hypothetical protein MMC17_006789 [Xylographa soralifera]|nr:hypothetical protein [Xylographa soralifera]
MPVMEHEGTGPNDYLDDLLRSLRRPTNGASSMARRPNEIILARATTRYGEEAATYKQRHSPIKRTDYDTRRKGLKRGIGMNLISAVNAMPVTKKRLHNVGTQTTSMEPNLIPQLTRPLRNRQYQSKFPGSVDNAAWRTRDIFDLPNSDAEHNRPLQASMPALPQLQPEEIKNPTVMATNQRKRDLGDVGCACMKRRRLPLDALHLTNLNLSSPVIPVRTLENNLVVDVAFLL